MEIIIGSLPLYLVGDGLVTYNPTKPPDLGRTIKIMHRCSRKILLSGKSTVEYSASRCSPWYMPDYTGCPMVSLTKISNNVCAENRVISL